MGEWFHYMNDEDEVFDIWISPTLARKLGNSSEVRAYAYSQISHEMAAWRAMKLQAAMWRHGRA